MCSGYVLCLCLLTQWPFCAHAPLLLRSLACWLTEAQAQCTAWPQLCCTSLRPSAEAALGRAQSLLFWPTSAEAGPMTRHTCARTQTHSLTHKHTPTLTHTSSAQAGNPKSMKPGGDPDTIAGLQNRVCPMLSSRVHKVQGQPDSQRNTSEPRKPGGMCDWARGGPHLVRPPCLVSSSVKWTSYTSRDNVRTSQN